MDGWMEGGLGGWVGWQVSGVCVCAGGWVVGVGWVDGQVGLGRWVGGWVGGLGGVSGIG